jgi:hypothetical protein
MKTYPDFKREYIATLTELLNERVDTSDIYIGSPTIRELSSKLADMEELYPNWTNLVEDWLAERHLLQ